MTLSANLSRPPSSTAVTTCDVVVVGAGPYGLSVAAHLRAAGMEVAIFGKPMSLWRDQMPEGMLLRSHWWASNLSDPYHCYGIEQYFAEQVKKAPGHPISRKDFIGYGLWFQRSLVPDVDETYVSQIERQDTYFLVTLADGRVLRCAAVVMAIGLGYYPYRPAAYDHLPHALVTHSSEHANFAPFAGKRVVILGAGQSALESAALLHESGAEVSVIARHPIRWLADAGTEEDRSLLARIRYPKAGISPGWFNWGLETFPYAFQRLPRETRDQLLRGRGSYGPAGSGWLKSRIQSRVALYEGHSLQNTLETASGLELTLTNGQCLQADHLLLATGYQVNLWKLPMLPLPLLAKIRLYHNAPVLTHQFESSVPGLYFVGISSLLSCGPLYRFVVGTDAAARQIAHAIPQRLPLSGKVGLLA